MSYRITLPNPITIINLKHIDFLLFEAPNDANLSLYIKEMKKYNCKNLIRVCNQCYSEDILLNAGITVHDFSFPDGTVPPHNLIKKYLTFLQLLKNKKLNDNDNINNNINNNHINNIDIKPCVAIHCVASLGRAPLLIGVALIEEGEDPLVCIQRIRNKRPGALNLRQVKYLHSYKKSNHNCLLL